MSLYVSVSVNFVQRISDFFLQVIKRFFVVDFCFGMRVRFSKAWQEREGLKKWKALLLPKDPVSLNLGIKKKLYLCLVKYLKFVLLRKELHEKF